MKTTNEQPKATIYFVVLALQVSGTLVFVWQQLPEFRQIAANPGKQLPYDTTSDLMMVGVFAVMQISFWYRQLYVPIPFRRTNMFLNYVFLFLSRLSFIFGSALFAMAVFRHLPELGPEIDVFLAVKRGMILVGCLFALFCASLEVERLAQVFEGRRN